MYYKLRKYYKLQRNTAAGPNHDAVINTSNELGARNCGNFDFITFLLEF